MPGVEDIFTLLFKCTRKLVTTYHSCSCQLLPFYLVATVSSITSAFHSSWTWLFVSFIWSCVGPDDIPSWIRARRTAIKCYRMEWLCSVASSVTPTHTNTHTHTHCKGSTSNRWPSIQRGGVAKSKRGCIWPWCNQKNYLHFMQIPPENTITHLRT